MISSRNPGRVWRGTLAEFTASPSFRKSGDICIPSDSPEIRICNGTQAFADLQSLPLGQAANVPVLGNTTNLTAIGGTFADLAAANTAVTTLRAETEARLAAIESSHDAVISALVAAALMA